MNKLRVGVILPDVSVPVWIARMLEKIAASSCAEVIAVAIAGDATGNPGRLYGKYFQLDRRFFRPSPDPWERKDVSWIVRNAQLAGKLPNGLGARFETPNPDVILNLSLNDLPVPVLDAARFGVWSLRCNGGRVVAGSDFGWIELLNDEHLIHCVVEAQRGASNQAVASAVMAAHPESFTHNQSLFLWRASALIPRALARLHARGEGEFFRNSHVLDSAAALVRPAVRQVLALVCRQAIRVFESRVWRRWFPQRWVLMSGMSTGNGLPVPGDLRPMIPPPGLFWADPFLLEREGKTYVIFEEYVYKDYRGHLSVAEMQQDGSMGESKVVLKRPYHLSYPFVFEHQGEWYMIPETAQNSSIELYRCTRFPDQWEYRRALMQNVRAVDATLIEESMLWWMFVNIAGEGGSTWDELHVFYSDDPLSDQWIPHPMNPVVADVRTARPAGRIFRRNGLLLRPSQDSSVRYGYGLNLNRITKLTRTEYEEELLERLEPPSNGGFIAVHTFNSRDGLAVIDMILRKDS